jgi:hypothetical protein
LWPPTAVSTRALHCSYGRREVMATRRYHALDPRLRGQLHLEPRRSYSPRRGASRAPAQEFTRPPSACPNARRGQVLGRPEVRSCASNRSEGQNTGLRGASPGLSAGPPARPTRQGPDLGAGSYPSSDSGPAPPPSSSSGVVHHPVGLGRIGRVDHEDTSLLEPGLGFHLLKPSSESFHAGPWT